MKKSLLAAAAILAAQAPVYALVGIGVSGGLNTTSISAKDDNLTGADLPSYFSKAAGAPGAPSLTLHRDKVSNLTQVGVKAWLELPLLPVEFELGTNLAWGNYASSLVFNDGSKNTVIPVDVSSPLAGFGDKNGSTPYASLLTDLTVRYPLIEIPPVLHTLKLYVGAGVTHVLATRVIDKKDIQSTFSSTTGTFNADAATTAVKDNLLQSTFGGHLSVGAQIKIPVIPIALYVDGKWYMNAAISDAASKYPFTVTAGLGFAL
jgi:hypothetical protein